MMAPDQAAAAPVFGTPSRTDHEAVIGFAGLARIAAEVLAAVAHGIAVLSAICASPDPESAARHIADALKKSSR